MVELLQWEWHIIAESPDAHAVAFMSCSLMDSCTYYKVLLGPPSLTLNKMPSSLQDPSSKCKPLETDTFSIRLGIEHTPGDEMCLLQFGKEDPAIANNNANNGSDTSRNNRLDEDGAGMDE